MEKISSELGVRAETLERWRAEALSEPERERTWTAEARLEAVIATASMDESARSGWCREHADRLAIHACAPGYLVLASAGREQRLDRDP